jgi:hypothetical protein
MAKFNIDLFSQDEGFGDTVKRAIKVITRDTIKECEPCEKRRRYLNRLIPYRNPQSKKYE